MLKEDYCSYEIAKLLKEKGFDEKVSTHYLVHPSGFPEFFDKKDEFTEPEDVWLKCPTHQMAMKWLREVHNIMISPYALSLGYYFEIFDLTIRDITGCKPLYKVGIPNKEDILSTYEEAVEAALKYCLENLI